MVFMRFFNNLKMWKKMMLSPLIVVTFLTVLSAWTYIGLTDQKAAIDDIYNNRFKNYQDCAGLIEKLATINSNLLKVVFMSFGQYDDGSVKSLAQEQIADINQAKAFLESKLKEGKMTEEEKNLYASMSEMIEEYRRPAMEMIEMVDAVMQLGHDKDISRLAAEAASGMENIEYRFKTLKSGLEELLELENKLSKDSYDFSLSSFSKTLSILMGLFVVAMVFSLATSIFISRFVSGSIEKTVAVIKKVADGDLTRDIEIGSTDEMGNLADSVNTMRIKMGEAVGQSMTISQILSESASEQAASLEETSASLDEMATMTKQTAANTFEANNLMHAANQAIEKANSSMQELTKSMKVIAGSSEQTQHIVKSIDEIAFQTNLLALNAAVEAARAGEAGAGFAVVADEVRNLAMRATESARNTSELIDDIVKKVKGGENLVSVTSGAFGDVRVTSNKVVDLTGEIAAAAKEQSEGINQVNRAVAEMNRVTQQNAANAEELASIMSVFKTERSAMNHDDENALLQRVPVRADAAETFIQMEEGKH